MFYDRFVELCKGKKVSASRAALENGNAYKKDQKSGGLSAPALWTVGDVELCDQCLLLISSNADW